MESLSESIIGSFNPNDDEFVSEIKQKSKDLIDLIDAKVPCPRRKALAITNIETAGMFAVKGYFQG